MTRKKTKNKGPDARGYNQSVPPKHNNNPPRTTNRPQATRWISRPRTYTLRLNEAMEKQLREFLGAFPLPKTKAQSSDRFEKRLTNLYDQLIDLGFAFDDIRQATLQLGYHITLDLALDWLCWHVDALPPRFVDERSNPHDASSVWVESIAKPKNDAPTIHRVDSFPHEAVYKKTEKENSTHDREDTISNAQKEWLLSQYKYEQEDEDYTYAEEKEEESEEGESADGCKMESKGHSTDAILHESDDMKEDRIKLQNLKAELEPLEAQLNDEASCYMMSKHELKAMRNRVRPLKNQIKGLEGKIAGRERKAALQLENEIPSENQPVESEEDGYLLDIFGNGKKEIDCPVDTSVGVQKKEGTSEEISIAIPKDSVPKSWTGIKPKALLEDYCRRQKLPQPSFQRVTKTSCKLRIKTRGEATEIDQDGPTLADAQHFAAIRALFQLDPSANIHHLLPPFHRDVWSEWKSAARSKENELRMDEGAKRRNEIDQLLRLLSQVDVGGQKGVRSAESEIDDMSTMESQLLNDSWEEIGDVKQSHTPKISAEDIRLKNDFENLQSSEEYQRLLASREKLPVYGFRGTILEAVDKNGVTIISAETGAGKTTQVPQFLLSHALSEGKGGHTSIICTQPRRVAATSVAERVAEEIGEKSVGGLVGYQIRMESVKSTRTKLLFCTTGVILRRLIEDPLLQGISHVIVDEVHERQWQIDVLLISLRTLLQGRRPDLKVILMSATLDSDLFSSYFWAAPVLKVPGRTFPVKNYFLEDLLENTGHIIEEGSRYAQRDFAKSDTVKLWVTTRGGEKRREASSLQSETDVEVSNEFEGYSMPTRRSMDRVDETILNYDLIEDVLELLFSRSSSFTSTDNSEIKDGAVLVFLPGLREIRTLMERLAGSRFFGRNSNIEVIPMHSSLSSKDQRRAFKPSTKGCRKIIISTNIAETSVTIPDVTCVIDSGLVREIQRDQRTGTQKLVTTWCSRANAKQRSGRAGRVRPGISLKLFSSKTDAGMKRVTEAELKRIPLEEVCLTILASGLSSSCKTFLANAPEPPLGSAIDFALEDLRCIGAITIENRGGSADGPYEKLTALGEHLTKIPIDARLGKMLLYGSMFQCLDPALTLAACLSASQSPFASSLSMEGDEVRAAQSTFHDTSSDFLTLLNVWEAFVSEGSGARHFCRDKFLNYNALREIADAREQFLTLLCSIGFVDRETIGDCLGSYNAHSRTTDVIHFVVCAGLYPNVAMVEDDFGLVHKTEKLVIHNSSVNRTKVKERSSDWVAFHEKLGTGSRVSVSTTCFVHPFSIFLLGPALRIDHVARKVEIDNWIKLDMTGRTSVLLRELRRELDRSLESYIQDVKGKNRLSNDARVAEVIDQILCILCQL